ncbi:hypothetical protein ACXO2S_02600 [Lactobacillus delbrueckii subsp. bulgaricus]
MEARALGKIGYVANSPYTVLGESRSAGRLYDLIDDGATGRVLSTSCRKGWSASWKRLVLKKLKRFIKNTGIINLP